MDMQISQILLLSAVLLVGLIILAIGFFREKRTVEVAGISLIIAVLIAFFIESQEVRDILVSFAIIVVAITSAVNINELRNDRKKAVEKENRERKEKLLNEIIVWAKNVLTRGLESGKQSEFERSPENIQLFKNHLFQYVTDLRRLNRDGIYVKHFVLTDWKGLEKKIKQVRREIGRHVESINMYIDNIDDEAKCEEANEHRNKMNEIAEAIIKEAMNIKIKLLEVKS